MSLFNKMVAIFSEKPPMQEIGRVQSRIRYTWDENPDDLVQRKGIKYLQEISRDTHISSCLRTRRQKLLKTPWKIQPADTSEEALFWADFVKWNIENMDGEFLQDLEGMHRAIGYGFSVSEINWRIIESGEYANMVGLKSICYKPEDLIHFKTNEFGHTEKIFLQNRYSADSVELPVEKVIHVIYGDNDENPYGDPTLSRVAFWAWLKKNEAQFWAIFSEKFGMPTAKATIPNNAKKEDEERIKDILHNLQAESGIMLPQGFDLTFLEATRSGEVGYDNFIERCNKEISKEILGQTLTSEEGKRGQGSYALGTIHAATLEDYVSFDAVLIQSAINKQLIRRLIAYNSDTQLLPQFQFISEIDPLILAQNFPAIAGAIEIPRWWVYDKFGIPFPHPDEPTVRLSTNLNIPQKGVDNKALSVFAEKTDALWEQRDKIFSQLEPQILNQLAENIDGVFQNVVAQFKKKVEEGEAIEKPPAYSINVGKVKDTLITAAIYYHLLGKYMATRALEGKVDLPKPHPLQKFDENLQFESPEAAVQYFSQLVAITKPEMRQLLEIYEERYFTVAGLVKNDIQRIFDSLVVGLEKGWNWQTFEGAIREAKIKYTGYVFGTDMTNEPLGANHLKTIFQNNMMRAYQEGAQKIYDDPEVADEIWGYQYVAVGDDRTRPSHAALNGTVREKDDPFWLKYTPPWDHGCRCDRIPILRSQVASGEYQRSEKLPKIDPEEGFATRRL